MIVVESVVAAPFTSESSVQLPTISETSLAAPNFIIETVIQGPQGPTDVASVFVVTGSEARPDANLVIWMEQRTGSPTEPVNMGTTDLWVS